jgi:hypothetical protein
MASVSSSVVPREEMGLNPALAVKGDVLSQRSPSPPKHGSVSTSVAVVAQQRTGTAPPAGRTVAAREVTPGTPMLRGSVAGVAVAEQVTSGQRPRVMSESSSVAVAAGADLASRRRAGLAAMVALRATTATAVGTAVGKPAGTAVKGRRATQEARAARLAVVGIWVRPERPAVTPAIMQSGVVAETTSKVAAVGVADSPRAAAGAPSHTTAALPSLKYRERGAVVAGQDSAGLLPPTRALVTGR